MSHFRQITDQPSIQDKYEKVVLDERFVAQFIGETPLDRVEAQELRQVMLRALQSLTRDELRVVELRYQHKKSRGQVASKLELSRENLATVETAALDKLRKPLSDYMNP